MKEEKYENEDDAEPEIPKGGHEELIVKHVYGTSNPIEDAEILRKRLISSGWKVKIQCSDNAQLSRQQAKVLFKTPNTYNCDFFKNHPELFIMDGDLMSIENFKAGDLATTDPVWVNKKLNKIVKGFKTTDQLYTLMDENK